MVNKNNIKIYRDGEGGSCLHLAAQFGHTAIVGYLIAKGQNVNTQVILSVTFQI